MYNLTGKLLGDINNLPSPRYLDLRGNYFFREIPAEYGRFEALECLSRAMYILSLQHLYLGYYNSFSASLPPEIGNLSQLILLDAASCGLSGEIPREHEKLQHLDTLYLCNFKNLKCLDVSENVLIGEIPGSFAKLKKLTLLNLF